MLCFLQLNCFQVGLWGIIRGNIIDILTPNQEPKISLYKRLTLRKKLMWLNETFWRHDDILQSIQFMMEIFALILLSLVHNISRTTRWLVKKWHLFGVIPSHNLSNCFMHYTIKDNHFIIVKSRSLNIKDNVLLDVIMWFWLHLTNFTIKSYCNTNA